MPPQHASLPQTGGAAVPAGRPQDFFSPGRPAVPAMSGRVIAPGAHPAVAGDGSLWTRQTSWTAALEQLIRSCLGIEGRAGSNGVHGGPGRPYEDDLAESPYPQVTPHTVPVRLADHHASFEAEARQVPEQYSGRGGLVVEAVFSVLLARRSGGGA
ncbi:MULTISPECIES: hypothetical protein [Streptomyces]|uniref:hypothetical protein n=1 Tax=Streptomyces TaxID=1883 RepID=UPI00167A6870|nr:MULTISPECIES: hypothetical protein [Streptomyces]MBK3521176.1 hypothetical protein [Streptomyces sp. MBT70]GGR59292.1 hypothetical protein GCM10010236_09920 [Streptomyces eurythermus]